MENQDLDILGDAVVAGRNHVLFEMMEMAAFDSGQLFGKHEMISTIDVAVADLNAGRSSGPGPCWPTVTQQNYVLASTTHTINFASRFHSARARTRLVQSLLPT